MFFEQSVFHTLQTAHPVFLRGSDPVEYSRQGKTIDTAVYHDARRTLYINLG